MSALLILLVAGLLAACDEPSRPQSGTPATRQTQTVQTQTVQIQTARTQTGSPSSAQGQSAATRDPASSLRWISAGDLPREGQATLQAIGRGGPFRYSKDGVTFGNRERILPQHQRAYYREYTVPTPGEGDRGARRIVCGGQPKTSTAECYYSGDHYATFRRIRE